MCWKKAENRRCYGTLFVAKKNVWMNIEQEPVIGDWMQKVVGFHFRWCRVQGKNGTMQCEQKHIHSSMVTTAQCTLANALKTIELPLPMQSSDTVEHEHVFYTTSESDKVAHVQCTALCESKYLYSFPHKKYFFFIRCTDNDSKLIVK